MPIASLAQPAPTHLLLRKAEIFRFLEEVCQTQDLTQSQLEEAQTSYQAVANWLSESTHPLLQNLKLYAHGSTALGTTVRPLGQEEFDVDLICLSHLLANGVHPADLKAAVGFRLKEHKVYATLLEEKKRCWRINYQRAFHLDISPTVPNPKCTKGGELVPDKALRTWKATNPTGYRKLFDERANLLPRMASSEEFTAGKRAQAEIAPFPQHGPYRGALRRIVQLLKRHRDVSFANVKADIAPISIVITTLASQSYAYCVRQFTFDSELDVVVATIRLMPLFINVSQNGAQKNYAVWNETTEGENFAERWNDEPERAQAFYQWHAEALEDFVKLASLEGLDLLSESLTKSLGAEPVNKVLGMPTATISEGRKS
jgi:Second Messenger Oligonucleotide or Dinucleotide Synthetase domain